MVSFAQQMQLKFIGFDEWMWLQKYDIVMMIRSEKHDTSKRDCDTTNNDRRYH